MLVVSSGFFSAALVTVSIATAFAVLSNALHCERHAVFTLEVEACSLAGKSFGCCESTANLSYAINKSAVDFKTSLIKDFEIRDRVLDPATRDTKQAKMVGTSFPFKSLLWQNQTAFRALLTFQQVRTGRSKKRRFHGNQHSKKMGWRWRWDSFDCRHRHQKLSLCL